MSSSDYRKKVEKLKAELENHKAQNSDSKDGSGMSWTLIACGVIPIVIFAILYLTSPSFVCSPIEEGSEEMQRSIGKIIAYTSVVTILLWGCVYGYQNYSGAVSTTA